MPYLHCGLGESLQPGLEGLVVPLFNLGELSWILEVPLAPQELRSELRPQILPTRDGVDWESVPPPTCFAREDNIEQTALNGIRVAISAGPRGVNPQEVRRIPSPVE